MPSSRAFAYPRVVVLTALTAGLLATTTGVAAADTTTPTTGTTTAPDPSDPTTPVTTDPGTPGTPDPTDPATPVVDPTITYTLPQASAHLRYERKRHMRRMWHRHAVHAVLSEARRQAGKPYVYGGSGPSVFDCSGLVRFVFGHAIGRWLPHNAAAQYGVVKHIKRRQLEPGDLVFQESGGYPFHVGIYAGHDKWWHAPHSGDHVRKQTIYRGHLYYGRVLVYPRHTTHRRHR